MNAASFSASADRHCAGIVRWVSWLLSATLLALGGCGGGNGTADSSAPSIVDQPASISVKEGQAASFSVTAKSTAPISYQWLRDGVAVSGANASTYTIEAVVSGDDGAVFTVRVTNAVGSATSNPARLSVAATSVSPVTGRTWQPGQLLETQDDGVYKVRTGIDDAGRVTVVFNQGPSGSAALIARRGQPNGPGTAPTWSTPHVIASASALDVGLRVAPGGNALAYWTTIAPCTASSYRTSGDCLALFAAVYRAASDTWEAPQAVYGWAPTNLGYAQLPEAVIDDDANVVLFGGFGWVRSGTSWLLVPVLNLRGGTEPVFRQQLLTDPNLSTWSLAMDNHGNLLAAGKYRDTANSTTNIAAFRGAVASGVSTTPEILDSRLDPAEFLYVAAGVGGQQVVIWVQNNGTTSSAQSAFAASPGAPFVAEDLGFTPTTATGGTVRAPTVQVTDAGEVLLVDWHASTIMRRGAAGGWHPAAGLDSSYLNGVLNRRGDIVGLRASVSGTDSFVLAFDAIAGTALPSPGWVLGIPASPPVTWPSGLDYLGMVVSMSGVAFVTLDYPYDVLPTPSQPAGSGRPNVANLWGFFLR